MSSWYFGYSREDYGARHQRRQAYIKRLIAKGCSKRKAESVAWRRGF